MAFGTHRVYTHGSEEKRKHAANMAAGGDPMPVRRSPFVERDQRMAAKEKIDREAAELAMQIARERAFRAYTVLRILFIVHVLDLC